MAAWMMFEGESGGSEHMNEYQWFPKYDLRTRSQLDSGAQDTPSGTHISQPSMMSSLCDFCSSLFSGRRKEGENGEEHPVGQTLDQTVASALRACRLCHIRSSRFKRVLYGHRSAQDVKFMFEQADYNGSSGNILSFTYTLEDSGRVSKSMHFIDLVSCRDFPLADTFSRLRRRDIPASEVGDDSVMKIETSNNGPSTFRLIKHWIEQCQAHHSKCSGASEARSLPTRLIDLGQSEAIQPTVRGVAKLPPGRTQYTTLSHCWGGKRFLRLLRSNEESFGRGLPLSQLPKTFREAMEVTKRMGIRYIWIDSLCILQDSHKDWNNESQHMAEVYRHSFCNIAAADAESGTAGLFRRRKLVDVEPCRVNTTWNNLSQGTIFCADWFSRDEMDFSPLARRGWVAQEMVLSPRVVHFARTQVWWSCAELQANETFPDRIPNGTENKLSMFSDNFPHEKNTTETNLQRLELWGKAVHAYSIGDLTFRSKDKLMAIAGIAELVGFPASSYLAGMWRENLADQLAWMTCFHAPEQGTRNVIEYRAPSWSWASIDGPVHFGPMRKGANVEVLDAHTVLQDSNNAYGPVLSGFIRLRGMLAHVQFQEKYENGSTEKYLGEARTGIYMDGEQSAFDNDCFFLPLNHRYVHGLIIRPTGKQRGEYERCGIFSIYCEGICDRMVDFCRNFEDLYGDDEELVECKAGRNSDAIQTYVISLV